MLLRIGHGTGFKPTVEHLRRSTIGLPVLLDLNLVDHMLVQVIDAHAGQRFEFITRTDADRVLRIFDVHPDRNARTPEAVAADIPVLRILQPVTKAIRADRLRYPRDLVVIRDQIVTYIFDLHVPGFDRAINERRIRSFAERITMLDRALVNELPLILQALDDRLVRILTKQAEIFG